MTARSRQLPTLGSEDQSEFHVVVRELLELLAPVAERNPEWLEDGIVERFIEPERQIAFRVTWIDEHGRVQVNRGYRVQFNSALGPYCGGTDFGPTVTLGTVKAAALEQTLSNALTGSAIGGARGGSDFDSAGKSDREVMRFCQSFMTELQRYTGENADVLTADGDVAEREIGYLYGQYRRLKGADAAAMTGKGHAWGGTYCRVRATGFGIGYFMDTMLAAAGRSLEGATVVVSGSGPDSIYANKKTHLLGALVVAMSDSGGYLHDPDGISYEAIKQLTSRADRSLRDYVHQHPGATYIEDGAGIWDVPCDIAIACSDGIRIDDQAAARLVSNGCCAVGEGADRAVTRGAAEHLLGNGILLAPATAVRAGAAAIAAFEMRQNSERSRWEWGEVDERLRHTMAHVHHSARTTAEEYGFGHNLVAGSRIAAFLTIANAMYAQGVAG